MTDVILLLQGFERVEAVSFEVFLILFCLYQGIKCFASGI